MPITHEERIGKLSEVRNVVLDVRADVVREATRSRLQDVADNIGDIILREDAAKREQDNSTSPVEPGSIPASPDRMAALIRVRTKAIHGRHRVIHGSPTFNALTEIIDDLNATIAAETLPALGPDRLWTPEEEIAQRAQRLFDTLPDTEIREPADGLTGAQRDEKLRRRRAAMDAAKNVPPGDPTIMLRLDALKMSVEWGSAVLHNSGPFQTSPSDVVNTAGKFFDFLSSGKVPDA